MNLKQKAQTLSIIIPVYNEEDYIRACLESIAEQTVRPLEVIIVDNNSTDATCDIAKQFHFTRIIRERRQHQSYAQHRGFAAAKGDIIGRIDADTLLPPDWVENYLKEFNDDASAVALSGSGLSYDSAYKKIGERIFKIYFGLADRLAGHKLMWGSNCAFRRSAWSKIKDDLLLRDDIWEDYDLGFALGKHGRIGFIDNKVGVSYRAIHRTPRQMCKYQLRSVRTFYLRCGRLRAMLFFLGWSSLFVVTPFALVDQYLLQPVRNIPVIKLLGESWRG